MGGSSVWRSDLAGQRGCGGVCGGSGALADFTGMAPGVQPVGAGDRWGSAGWRTGVVFAGYSLPEPLRRWGYDQPVSKFYVWRVRFLALIHI